jgi:hypothetical protein
MTAIIYFGEMLVASLLAIALLAISRLPMSSDAVLFAKVSLRGPLPNISCIVSFCMVSHQPNIGCITPIPTERSSQFFGRYGFVSRWSI